MNKEMNGKYVTIEQIFDVLAKRDVDAFSQLVLTHPFLLAENEKRRLIAAVQAGDRDALNQLVSTEAVFAVSIAKQYVRKGLHLCELIEHAVQSIIDAVEAYDLHECNEVKFTAFAASKMRECLSTVIAVHKTKIFVDMDGVLVNFQSGIDKLDKATKRKYADDPSTSSGQVRKAHYDDVPGIFSTMDPMPGALDAVRALQAMGYDLYILSTAPWGNPSAWADKVAWVTKHLDDVFHKKMIITHCKGLLAAQEGAYLIDDRTGHGASDFGERHIQFGTERFPDWASVVEFLQSKRAEFERLADQASH